MRLLRADVTNFVSYSHLSFSFDQQGLALIYGATGSGKSTLQDIPAWILFNTTAKGTAVDEVRNWANLDEPTKGIITLDLAGEIITVTRARGKPNQNDLYWEDSAGLHRGKDITETQVLLEAKLGVSKDLYVAAAYYNEFSPTAGFFTAKAKDRRELFESLANLSFPIQLADVTASVKKDNKKELKTANELLFKQLGIVENINKSLEQIDQYISTWDKQHADNLVALEVKLKNFDKEKQSKIEAIRLKMLVADEQMLKTFNTVQERYNNALKKLSKAESEPNCTSCGQPIKEHMDALRSKEKLERELLALDLTHNPHNIELQLAEAWLNPYNLQLETEKQRVNPHTDRKEKLLKQSSDAEWRLLELDETVKALEEKINMLDQLYDLSFKLRGALLLKAVKEVETNTNRLLETYFDSALRVTLNMDKAGDDLDVSIAKDGHECSYRQLSKGQRGLLKLCFSVSVMSLAANKAGLKFETLFFDEALDGLDSELKVKAFNLFSELEQTHSSVLVIDHNSELQTLFTKQYHVKLVNGESEITSE